MLSLDLGGVYNFGQMETDGTKSMLGERPLLVLMDGHAMVHRAWHAIQQPLNVSRTGEEVRAVYGFLNTFLRNLADWQPTHCAIAFDLPGPTFRHQRFAEYKAQRPPSPPELRSQFRHVRRMMEVLRIPVFEQEAYEADDILGTLCRQAEELEIETLILTGDTDTLQLVSPWVRVALSYSVQKKTVYDEAAVRERYGGLGPSTVPDIKALQGDTSDNIPGVPGIGSKTAIRLLREFGTVEALYEDLDRVTPAKMQESLRKHKELALRGKMLTTIVRDVAIKLDLGETRFWRYDRASVVEALTELEFFSMVPRIPDPEGDRATATQAELFTAPEPRDTHYEVVDTEETLDALVRRLASPEGFALSVETSTPRAMDCDVVGLAFSNAPERGWYVPTGHAQGRQLPLERVLESFRPLLEDESIPKVAHNASFGMTVLARYGIHLRNLAFDTMVGAHISGRKSLGLNAVALETLHQELTPLSDLVGTGKKRVTMAEVPVDRAAEYAAAHADATMQMHAVLAKAVEDTGGTKVLETVELPLVPVLVRMQVNGTVVDVGLLEQMSTELGGETSRIEAEMYALVGHEFNLNSSQQLGEVLFKELRLPPTKRTQKGHSTDASSLERLKQVIDQGEAEDVDPKALQVLDQILEYRQLSKIKSTYVDALPALVNPRTGRIHTSYNQTGSATGRVSSNDPNVQNIPVKTELGKRVRKAFVAEKAPEWTLLAADYSQIELRILAHISGDPGLLEAFESGLDIHSATASSVYGVDVDGVTPDMRRVAKVMNFGVIYGLSPFGVSQQTGLSPDEGKAFIETYFGKYPGISQYVDTVKAQVRRRGTWRPYWVGGGTYRRSARPTFT